MSKWVLTMALLLVGSMGLGCEDDPTDLDYLDDAGSPGAADAGNAGDTDAAQPSDDDAG